MLATMMPNGVTVSDWLGTSAVAARICAQLCEEMRDSKPAHGHYPTALNLAIAEAEQVVSELHAIRNRITDERG
jgi:hypothetical protein